MEHPHMQAGRGGLRHIGAYLRRLIAESGTVSSREVLFFTKNLSTLLRSGSTLVEAITVGRDQAHGRWRAILDEIRGHVEEGFPMSDALKRHPKVFPSIYRSIIAIGEQSGTLEENCAYLALQLEKQSALRRKVVGAMLYPLVILIGAVAVSAVVVIFVLPKIARLFSSFRVELPWTTRVLLAVARFTEAHGTWFIPLCVVGVVAFVWVLRQRQLRPMTHWVILHTPILRKLSQNVNTAMFCRTLGVLLRTGTTIDDGISACAKTVPNIRYERFLAHAHGQVKGGSTLADTLRTNPVLFSPTDIQILQVGEKSGTLVDALDECAKMNEEGVEALTKNIATILEPVVLLVLGLFVAIIALSIIAPIYSITEQFRR